MCVCEREVLVAVAGSDALVQSNTLMGLDETLERREMACSMGNQAILCMNVCLIATKPTTHICTIRYTDEQTKDWVSYILAPQIIYLLRVCSLRRTLRWRRQSAARLRRRRTRFQLLTLLLAFGKVIVQTRCRRICSAFLNFASRGRSS